MTDDEERSIEPDDRSPRDDSDDHRDESPRDDAEPLGDLADSVRAGRSIDESPLDSANPVEEPGRRDDEPLGWLVDEFQEEHPAADAGDESDAAFEEMGAPELDTDAVWSDLEDESGDGQPGEAERRVDVLPKRSYCQRCEHFSKPPNMTCGNTGTEILELIDIDTVRVVNCPIAKTEAELRGSSE